MRCRGAALVAGLGLVLVLGSGVTAGAQPAPDQAAPAPADPPKKPRKKKRKKKAHGDGRWHLTTTAKVEATGGYLGGEGVVRDAGGFVRLRGAARPRLERGRWRLEAPVSVVDRETVGASFPERGGDLAGKVRYKRSPRLRIGAELGVDATWRPGWPDPYQPLAGGALATSDRRSHWDRIGGIEVASIPLRHQHARVGYQYRNVDHAEDANYDPFDAPTHLVPGDHEEHTVELSWVHFGDGKKLGGEVELAYQRWFFLYARDAGTGDTHAGAGGPPPNPLQETLSVEPAVVGELEIGPAELDLRYGVVWSSDLYDGYYSYVEQHPEIDLAIELPARATLTLDAELRWRHYLGRSYAVDPPGHPVLDWGDRRSDRTFSTGAKLAVPLGHGLSALAGVDLAIRRTNFPDYLPGVFPASRQYDVDWDHDDVTAWLGVGWALGAADDE